MKQEGTGADMYFLFITWSVFLERSLSMRVRTGIDTNRVSTKFLFSNDRNCNPFSTTIIKLKLKMLAERSFDLRTSGLWAQHASAAPLCCNFHYAMIIW